MLQVSRSSIQDALIGLVARRQGVGTIIREVSAESSVNPFTNELVSELLDFREMLEPPLAARTATRATAEEVSAMEEILHRQEEKQGHGDAIAEDAEFHYSVALASGNSVVLKVIDIIMDMLHDTRELCLQVEGRPQKLLAGHRRTLAAIKRHDAEAAKAAMRRHIEEIILEKF